MFGIGKVLLPARGSSSPPPAFLFLLLNGAARFWGRQICHVDNHDAVRGREIVALPTPEDVPAVVPESGTGAEDGKRKRVDVAVPACRTILQWATGKQVKPYAWSPFGAS